MQLTVGMGVVAKKATGEFMPLMGRMILKYGFPSKMEIINPIFKQLRETTNVKILINKLEKLLFQIK